MEKENWEIQFGSLFAGKGGITDAIIHKQIADFIRTQREQARREGIEACIAEIPEKIRSIPGYGDLDTQFLKDDLKSKLLPKQ